MVEKKQDPVEVCIYALQNAKNKEIAFEQAKIAHKMLWVIDVSDDNLSMEELRDLLRFRSIAMATIASVYVWNGDYSSALELENQFLFINELWIGDKRQVVEIYLMLLIIQKQTNHLTQIFNNNEFRNNFLEYEDIYLSYLNPHYEFKSTGAIFVDLLNRINNYSRMLNGHKLM